MKKIVFFVMLLVGAFGVTTRSYAQQNFSTKFNPPVIATVAVVPRDGIFPESLSVEFSEPISDKTEILYSGANGKQIIDIKTDMMRAVLFESACIARSVEIDPTAFSILFRGEKPSADKLKTYVETVLPIIMKYQTRPGRQLKIIYRF